jgi:protein-disulfide isomerase
LAKNHERDKGAIVAKHLLSIAALGDPVKSMQSLNDWYLQKEKDYSRFAAKYPMNGQLEEQRAKIDAMSKWCKDAEITHTPTIFINGYRMPENYRIEELKNIL